MIGVRGAGAAFLLPYLEIVLLKNVVETVVAHTVLLAKLLVVHLPQLAPAYTRVFTADFLDILHAESLIGQSGHQAVSMLVIGLFALTKQSTQRGHRIDPDIARVKPVDYLDRKSTRLNSSHANISYA